MTSRRNMLGLLFGAGIVGGVTTKTLKAQEKRERRYSNGKLICRCEDPEYDEVSEPALSFDSPFRSEGRYGGGTVHPIATAYLTQSGAWKANYIEPFWSLRTTNHCIYCGGVEAPDPDDELEDEPAADHSP